MAKYQASAAEGAFLYIADGGVGATLYGAGVGLPSLSVQPFSGVALDYDLVEVTWLPPSSTSIVSLRLTRNQDGIPDSPEDGALLVEDIPPSNYTDKYFQVDGKVKFVDDGTSNSGESFPLVPGRHTYYSIWILLSDETYSNEWVLAGVTRVTVPESHQTRVDQGTSPTLHEKFLDLLPRVLTTPELNPMGSVDYDSDLSKFMSAITFTFDELLTEIDLLLPNWDFTNLPPELLNAVAYNYGLSPETRLSTTYQKKLLREIIGIYEQKGTLDALVTFVESLTGFVASVQESPNLMLDSASSTFYKGIGDWTVTNGATISSVTEQVPPTSAQSSAEEIDRRIDNQYTGKVAVTAANAAILLGSNSPKLQGIPVSPGEAYTFSFYQNTVTSLNYAITISWYNMYGKLISSSSTTTVAATGSWSRVSSDPQIAPDTAEYASIKVQFSATSTAIYLDMMQFSIPEYDTYYEARGIGIGLTSQKVNYLTNPSFETNTTSWAGTNATLSRRDVGTGTTPLVVIPGVPSGGKALKATSTSSASVVISSTTSNSITTTGDLTFSAYTYADSDQTYTVSMEAYAVAPYSNFVSIPTLTSSSSGWTFSAGTGGTATQSYPTTGGPSGISAAWVKETITDAPESGSVSLTVTGIDVSTLHGNTEYVFKGWVKSDRTISVYPQVNWKLSTDVTEDIGDKIVIDANTWTLIEFTSISPYEVDDVDVLFLSDVAPFGDHDGWTNSVGAYIGFAKLELGFRTYTSSTTYTAVPGDAWYRVSTTAVIADDMIIPYDKDGLTVVAKISYTSTGDAVHVDAAQLESRFSPSNFFDGSWADGEWLGTANASASQYYPNKQAKLARLRQELSKYLPMGTPYYVTINNLVEYEGEFKAYA